jgi:XAP5, circadian clock regulator
VERHWYGKNKHIFPASRWEVSLVVDFCCCCYFHLPIQRNMMFTHETVFVQIYDPTKKWERYTIHGD